MLDLGYKPGPYNKATHNLLDYGEFNTKCSNVIHILTGHATRKFSGCNPGFMYSMSIIMVEAKVVSGAIACTDQTNLKIQHKWRDE